MHDQTVYLDCIDPSRVAAGPISITGVYLRGEIDPFLLQLPKRSYRTEILEAIDKTFEDPKNDLLQYYIWPTELNVKGFVSPVGLKAELICARLYFRSKCLPKYYIRRNKVIPASINRSLKLESQPNVGTYIAKWLNTVRREHTLTNRYQITYPEFELQTNLGLLNKHHLRRLLELGPRKDFHLENAIEKIPWLLAHDVSELDLKYLLKEPQAPKWWAIQKPDVDFTELYNCYLKQLVPTQFDDLPDKFKELRITHHPGVCTAIPSGQQNASKEKRKAEAHRKYLHKAYERLHKETG